MNRTIIDARESRWNLGLKELVQYRDLFYTLAWRDLRVRYAQTALGLVWAGVQPLATLVIFTLIFGRAIKVDTGGIPYPVFALSGMLGWSFFSYVMSQSGNSIIGAQEMVKKIYFPRLVIPLSKAVTGMVDYLITLIFLVGIMIYYGTGAGLSLLWLPLVFLMNVMAALGVGVWLSALTIRYRDFQHVVPFMVQLGLYATPVAYPASMVPEAYLGLYFVNPMAGITELYRFVFLGVPVTHDYYYISLMVALVLFVSGLFYFRRVERVMSDLV